MKIALIGNGRMGQTVARMALSRNHEICAVFDVDQPFTSTPDLAGARVLIDFSSPSVVINHIHEASRRNIPLIEGTTGWTWEGNKLKDIQGLTMLSSPNFSPGVYIFRQIVELAGKLACTDRMYDPYIHEWHHTGKADSPSGTALLLAQSLLDVAPGKKEIKTDVSKGKISADVLHVTSTRVGRIPGTHEVGFDSEFDQIVLRHTAFGREGFALGAVMAAEWIINKTGIFSMQDFMKDVFTL